MGGEEPAISTTARAAWGLPPRGRGRVSAFKELTVKQGITPAWAGKRTSCKPGVLVLEDYPRVGGEEPSLGKSPPAAGGLPPRGRGRVQGMMSAERKDGITPAWAGKS